MMSIKTFFCDTYALIEIIKGNKNYSKYTDFILVTSELNLMELYYSLLRDFGRGIAEKYFAEWEDSAVIIPKSMIQGAMELKYLHKKEKLSYIDCMGYIYALSSEVPFLTGDMKFEDKTGVEFVK
ncbi:PIN domain-containing protein [Candidatus Woesearchaeota archaeon]|nr:PIN domain-containing protein [Candidatus Woesearchaeota archaeon]